MSRYLRRRHSLKDSVPHQGLAIEQSDQFAPLSAPSSSHHLAYSGAVRALACASAASAGLIDRI
jgi:hypothetical protein